MENFELINSNDLTKRPQNEICDPPIGGGVDFAQAERFLEALCGDVSCELNFQTFDDCQLPNHVKRDGLTRVFRGAFAQYREELLKLNQSGAGVFVAINRCRNSSRNASNVIGLRACFVDSDDGALPPLPLEPSALVQSKHGQHAYWFLSRESDLKLFTPTQAHLSRILKTDPSVKDLPRVMRLPGFFHLKDPNQPFLVKILSMNDRRYGFKDIYFGFNIREPEHECNNDAERIRPCSPNQKTDFALWVRQLPIAQGSGNPFGGRNSTLLIAIREGLGRGIEEPELRRFVKVYCRRSGLGLDEAEEMLKRQQIRHRKRPFVSFFALAKKGEKTSPPALAREFLAAKGYWNGQDLSLRWWKADFYQWHGKSYRQIPETELRANVIQFLQTRDRGDSARRSVANEIVANLEALSLVRSEIEPPKWLSERLPVGSDESSQYLSFDNGILNLSDIIDGRSVSPIPHSPNYFCTSHLPYSYDSKAFAERWLKFLDEMIPTEEGCDFLQEWFGYHLIPGNPFQKLLMLIGEGANGKSVICTVLREMLGADNVSAVGLEAFNPTRTFPLAATVGKLANIAEEIGEIDKAAEGLLKQYSGGSMITIERKNRDAFNMTPSAKLTFATNIIPRFADRSDGLWRRFVSFPLSKQILDESKQDRRLSDAAWWRKSGQLAGVLNWSLVGLARFPNPRIEA